MDTKTRKAVVIFQGILYNYEGNLIPFGQLLIHDFIAERLCTRDRVRNQNHKSCYMQTGMKRGEDMIAVIDYDAGNLRSVEKALLSLGERVVITRDFQTILSADKVILPGVGAFGDAMAQLCQYGLVDVIHQVVDQNIPFLGICLGLQLMFESSEECEGVKGLGLLKGKILKIPQCQGLKIPHMGWNSLEINLKSKLFTGILSGAYVYFVHSYYLKAEEESVVAASTEYSTHIHAAVEKGNLFGCQFHPEKSGDVGLKILENFVRLE